MIALVGEIVAKYLPGQRGVAAQRRLQFGTLDAAHGGDDELALKIERRPCAGQDERQHAHDERDLGKAPPALPRNHGPAVHAGGLGFRNMDGREELLEGAGVERDRLKRLGIRERQTQRIESARFQIARRRHPDASLAIGILHPCIVRHPLQIDVNPVFIVQQQLRNEREPGIGKIADPGVGVLEPDLDDLHIHLLRGHHGAAFGRQIGDGQLDAPPNLHGMEQERSGLELAARGHDAQLAAHPAVFGVGIGQAPHVAHRRNDVPGRGRVGDAGCLEVGGDSRPGERGVAPRTLDLSAVDGVVRGEDGRLRETARPAVRKNAGQSEQGGKTARHCSQIGHRVRS